MISDLKYVFTKEGANSLGGFWNNRKHISLRMELAGILGNDCIPFYNPCVYEYIAIPALDGGHVLFLLYEVIARRKPNEKFMEYAQITGMALLFGLLIYANGNDLFRFILNNLTYKK